MLLIIITVCKLVCKSHRVLGLLANANGVHAHLLKGQLCTFQNDTLKEALVRVSEPIKASSYQRPRVAETSKTTYSSPCTSGEGSVCHKPETLFWTQKV